MILHKISYNYLYIDQIQDLAVQCISGSVTMSFVQTINTAFHVKLPKFNWSCQHNDTQMIHGHDFSVDLRNYISCKKYVVEESDI